MVDYKEKIDLNRLPRHIAIIMDGNGRWAKKQNQPRVFGHRNGVKSVREVSEAAAEIGIEYLTLYAFSTENWNRPRPEVNALMSLLVETIRKEVSTLMENNIRLKAIGDLGKLPDRTLEALREGIEITQNNDRMTLVLALNYSARWELMEAAKKIHWDATKGLDTEKLTEEIFQNYLATNGMPDPELLIRTSGELRISNFLLWQIAYSELYFTDKFWPDFRKNDLYEAIVSYQNRERRFGKISEQLA
ncbi:MAG: isoprenyl transferase [Saprospiraceae bacterium]|nr:isoprenyl transferase [Saprospiraceae bacterium]